VQKVSNMIKTSVKYGEALSKISDTLRAWETKILRLPFLIDYTYKYGALKIILSTNNPMRQREASIYVIFNDKEYLLQSAPPIVKAKVMGYLQVFEEGLEAAMQEVIDAMG